MAQHGRLGMVHWVFFSSSVNVARLIQGFRGQSEMLHLIRLGPLDGWLEAESEAGGFSQLLAMVTRNSASKSEAMISTR